MDLQRSPSPDEDTSRNDHARMGADDGNAAHTEYRKCDEKTPANRAQSLSSPSGSPNPHSRTRLGPGVWVPTDAMVFSYSRSRGPGGQNVNKRNTRAELRVKLLALGLDDHVMGRLRTLGASWLVGADHDEALLIASDEHRSQRRNSRECLERLRTLIVRAQQPPRIRKKTKPSWGAIQRRIEAKKHTGEKKSRRKRVDE